MKSFLLSLMFIFMTFTFSFAQDGCKCKTNVSSCEIKCSNGTSNCSSNWLGSCSCSCEKAFEPENPKTVKIDFNLYEVKMLESFLSEDYKKEYVLIVNKLSEKLKKENGNIVFLENKEAEEVNSMLTKLFDSLGVEKQKLFHKKILNS